jgi:hypothetical protein
MATDGVTRVSLYISGTSILVPGLLYTRRTVKYIGKLLRAEVVLQYSSLYYDMRLQYDCCSRVE